MTNAFTRPILIASAAVMLALAACSDTDKPKTAPAAPPAPVTIQEVQLQPTTYYDEYPGTTVALSQVDLRAQVSGYITGIFFKEGEHVRKGQKLYEIDRSKYQASYTQAQASLAQARANQDKAQKDADRYTYLSKQDAIAKQILDHALTDLQNSKAGVSNANAAVLSAQTDLNFATILAPFDGTIGLSQVKLGTLVSNGQTLLNTISTDNPVAVDFVVNEKEIPRFTRLESDRNLPSDADSLFTIKLADNSLYNASGRISVLDRAVDPQTGTIRVRLVFPNQQGILKSGMSCTVRVHNQDAREQILIPNKATLEQMGEYFVFVARDTVIAQPDSAKKDGKAGQPQLVAIQKKVVLGQVIGGSVVVKSGLQAGEKIIVDGIQKLRDGAPVTMATPPSGPPQGSKNEQKPAIGGTNH